MTRPRLIGEIVEYQGMICLSNGAGVYYSLMGNSGIAHGFRETFNDPSPNDVGRNLYNDRGELVMESIEQMKERKS